MQQYYDNNLVPQHFERKHLVRQSNVRQHKKRHQKVTATNLTATKCRQQIVGNIVSATI
jgi:hypothetical protein